jgi:DNA-binding NarL/FixJ family response regulator
MTVPAPIRVLLVDDHALFRDGVRAVLAGDPGFEVVGEANDGAEAVVRARRCRPDVVLLDLRMPGMDGVEAIGRLCATRPQLRVLVLTTYDSDQDVLPAIEAGAHGYLLKDATRGELLAAVRAAARGERVVAQAVVRHLISRTRTAAVPPALNSREVELLQLVAEGATNQQAAARLHVSTATIKAYLTRIYDKLGVPDRAAAVGEGYRRGILR